MAVPRASIDLVPPAQPDEPAPGDVFQVVEIGREEEHGDYEDEDAGLSGGVLLARDLVWGGKGRGGEVAPLWREPGGGIQATR